MLADHFERAGPVVAVLPEAFGNHSGANHHKDPQAGEQNDCRPNQVSRIP